MGVRLQGGETMGERRLRLRPLKSSLDGSDGSARRCQHCNAGRLALRVAVLAVAKDAAASIITTEAIITTQASITAQGFIQRFREWLHGEGHAIFRGNGTSAPQGCVWSTRLPLARCGSGRRRKAAAAALKPNKSHLRI